MDHILQVRAEHQSYPQLGNRGGVARFTRSAGDASLVTLALAAIGFLALFLSPCFSVAGSPSSSLSTLSARLVAVVAGSSIFTSKTAPFLLSNVIFVLLVADYYRCCCFDATASAGHAAASSGEPGGVPEKEAQHHQVQVEQCAVQSCVPCSESLEDHNEQEGEDRSTVSANTLPDEEELSHLELDRLGEEEDSSATLELEETVDAEDPTCETAQGPLDRLEISELNKKFDEFIRSRRIKWVKEEACLLLYEV